MSTDRISCCPACRKNHARELATAEAAVAEAYGMVTSSEYLELVEAVRHLAAHGPDATLALNCEANLSPDGIFSIFWWCRCRECGWSWQYQHEEEVSLEGSS